MPRVKKVYAGLETLVPERIEPFLFKENFKEDFLNPGVLATFWIGTLEDVNIRFDGSCVGCGSPEAPPMMVPWFMKIDYASADPHGRGQMGWLPIETPICLQCHRFGLFDLVSIDAKWSFNHGSRVFVRLPSVAAYEPFREANHLRGDAWLTRPGLEPTHSTKAPMDEVAAEEALRPALNAWFRMEERFGLHRYLRIKGRLRQLSARKGIRKKPLLSSEEIWAGLSELMREEDVSPEDLREIERLMKERVQALAELA